MPAVVSRRGMMMRSEQVQRQLRNDDCNLADRRAGIDPKIKNGIDS